MVISLIITFTDGIMHNNNNNNNTIRQNNNIVNLNFELNDNIFVTKILIWV